MTSDEETKKKGTEKLYRELILIWQEIQSYYTILKLHNGLGEFVLFLVNAFQFIQTSCRNRENEGIGITGFRGWRLSCFILFF